MSGSEQEGRKEESDFPYHPSSLLPPPPPYQPPQHLTSHTSASQLQPPGLLYPGLEFPITPPRRGPGRPRKDGLSPVVRRKSQKTRTGRGRGISSRSDSYDDSLAPVPSAETLAAAALAPLSDLDTHGQPMSRGSSTQASPVSTAPPISKASPADSGDMDPMDLTTDFSLPSSSSTGDMGPPLGQSPARTPERSLSREDPYGIELAERSKMCALCNCGERSLLGQGELSRYEPSPGYNALKKGSKVRRSSAEFEVDKGGDKSPKHLTWRRIRGPSQSRDRSKSPRRPNPHQIAMAALADELSTVGFPEETELQQLFEPTGHTWAHHCCAAWSERVIQDENFVLKFVDRAVYAGYSQKCSYCKRYGATITCRFPKCSKKYHYPCASGGGCFQDIKTLSLLCPEHIEQAESIGGQEANCVVCDTPGEIGEQLFCTSCGQHYHGNCLDPPVEVNPIVRAGWQCPECKICQTCRMPGDDNKMLVCDTCDKGYHTYCLRPIMTTIPKNGWKCKNCRVCGDCGSRTPGGGLSSRWHLNYSVCDSCYQQRNKGLSCPLCRRAYRHFTQKTMVPCTVCKKHVHAVCDETIDMQIIQRRKEDGLPVDYICPVCKNRDPAQLAVMAEMGATMSDVDLHEAFNLFKDDNYMKDEVGEMSLHSSQDSLLQHDDSLSSMDIDFGSLNKGPDPDGLAQDIMLPCSASGPPAQRQIGPGKGKPSYGKKFGKKIGTRRPGQRLGIGRKRQRHTAHGETRRRGPRKRREVQGGGDSSNKRGQSADDDDHHATVVLVDTKDEFVLGQDMCMSCGSYGDGEEGKLIVCTQCGQCYHPYCVNIKISKVVLEKGWRCLDCTVCEGCCKASDEGRLILCDECDISYHIYCLNPPLDHVPKGTWKCKWCVHCVMCGVTTPGYQSQWQNNYTTCAPCHSVVVCPVCRRNYQDGEVLIQCAQCDRWLHTFCDGIYNDDDAERAADNEYNCYFCRPFTGASGPFPPSPPPPEPEKSPSPPPVPKEIEMPRPVKQYFMDGVWVSESGLQQIKSLSVKKAERSRRRPRQRSMEHVSHQQHPQLGRLLSAHGKLEGFGEEDDALKDLDESMKDPIMPEGVLEPGEPLIPESGVDPNLKQRKRKPWRVGVGVGGFISRARHRGPWFKQRAQAGGARRDINPQHGDEEGDGEDHAPGEEPVVEGTKRRKRRNRPRRGQIEECFPSYMQEAFFGRAILDSSKKEKGPVVDPSPEDEVKASPSGSTLEVKDPFMFAPPPSPSEPKTSSEPARAPEPEPASDQEPHMDEGDDLTGILPIVPDVLLPHDEDIFSILDFSKESTDIATEQPESQDTSQEQTKDLESILGVDKDMGDADMDKMLREPLVPIDSKTVEDLFQGVLTNDQTQGPSGFPMPPLSSRPASSQVRPPQMGSGQMLAQLGGTMSPPTQGPPPLQQFPSFSSHPGPGQGNPPIPPSIGIGEQLASSGPSWQPPRSVQPKTETEPETEHLSYNKKNIMKWEKDEPLGLDATISPVLFSNTHHPDLIQRYPDWSERSKNIMKFWRKATTEQKAPILAKARINRAALRTQRGTKAKRGTRKKKKVPTATLR